jgi:hypothetical protein
VHISTRDRSDGRTYEVGVDPEEQVALKQQQASNDLSAIGVSIAKYIHHLLVESVFLGLGAGRKIPGSVLLGGLSGDGVLGCSSAQYR